MLFILEPVEGGGPPLPLVALPKVRVDLPMAPGRISSVEIEVTEEAVAEVVETLYRTGGDDLTDALLDQLDPRADPGDPLRRQADDLCRRQIMMMREQALASLVQLHEMTFSVLRDQLGTARAALHLSRYGLVPDTGVVRPPVAGTEQDRATYQRLRKTLVELDGRRRRIRRHTFTIPVNAPRAREQFNADLEPYVTALRQAIVDWPALAVCGAGLLDDLGDERRSAVENWARAQDGTRLDDLLKKALADAWSDLVDSQPSFLADQMSKAGSAVRNAEQLAPPRLGRPEKIFGMQHPLWRYPHLVQIALERLDLRPGDIGYAAAISALRHAEEHAAGERGEEIQTDAALGWASLGFGILVMVPVVGQFAVIAVGVTAGARALRSTLTFLDARSRRAALGPLADRYGFAEPNAAGFVVDLLGLASEVALPVLGKALSATLVPAGRLLAASRISAMTGLGALGADLAGLAVSANAAALEKELNRLGLAQLERQAGR
ncbi:hypothetical protein [Nonomuraea endophytica]|uniref:hypothetical protein n=1 Tax=Nonomuraea endophytica TaxID=714136 RepID=UPI0037C86CE5